MTGKKKRGQRILHAEGEKEMIEELADRREFRRLRNYYRRNFEQGESDDAFILWCEIMCEEEGGESIEE